MNRPVLSPRFTHDCADCRLVAVREGIDLYICPTGDVVARHGNREDAYKALPVEMVREGRFAPYIDAVEALDAGA
jgi:hypothetical protein